MPGFGYSEGREYADSEAAVGREREDICGRERVGREGEERVVRVERP